MNPRTRFLVTFAALIVGLYLVVASHVVNDSVVVPFTAGIARVTAATLRMLGEDAAAVGQEVRGPGAAVAIENGCNGLEATIVLAAAVVAFPARWKSRAIALALGSAGVQLLNLVRTTSLYLSLKYRPVWFETMHTSVWQTILVGAAVAFFFAWSSRQRVGDNPKPSV